MMIIMQNWAELYILYFIILIIISFIERMGKNFNKLLKDPAQMKKLMEDAFRKVDIDNIFSSN